MPNAHTSLVAAVISYINARGGFAWRNQTGVLPVAGRYVHAGKPGVPDVVGVIPYCAVHGMAWRTNPFCLDATGRLIAVECKTGTGRLSKIQQQTHEELRKRGALVLVVRSVSELEHRLQRGLP